MTRSFNELREANNVIEEDNKSYMEKLSNMGEQVKDKEKYKEIKKKFQHQEKLALKFQNQYLIEKAEVDGLKREIEQLKLNFNKREEQLSNDYRKLMSKYQNLQNSQ